MLSKGERKKYGGWRRKKPVGFVHIFWDSLVPAGQWAIESYQDFSFWYCIDGMWVKVHRSFSELLICIFITLQIYQEIIMITEALYFVILRTGKKQYIWASWAIIKSLANKRLSEMNTSRICKPLTRQIVGTKILYPACLVKKKEKSTKAGKGKHPWGLSTFWASWTIIKS